MPNYTTNSLKIQCVFFTKLLYVILTFIKIVYKTSLLYTKTTINI